MYIGFQREIGEDLLVIGGGGAWEGEGFVALASSESDVHWLLYLEKGETFVEASVEEGIVIARASEYPMLHEVRVPLHNPRWIQIATRHEP